MRVTGGRSVGLAAALVAIGVLAGWSYATGGFVFALLETTSDGADSLAVLRQYLSAWGAFGPIVYVLLVIVEVLVAPIPGTLLYAPGGAIFGGLLGGSLSLAGNVIGAGLAAGIARFWRDPIDRSLDSERFRSFREALAARGLDQKTAEEKLARSWKRRTLHYPEANGKTAGTGAAQLLEL